MTTSSPVESVTVGYLTSAVDSAEYDSFGADDSRLASDISRSPASSSTCSCCRYRSSIANLYSRSASSDAIQPRTVSSGMLSSSGLNQDSACFQRANSSCTCWRRALMVLSRWSSS